MTQLTAVLKGLFGLFVDDGPFTIAIVAWVTFVGLILNRVLADPLLRTGTFVLGLLVVLLASVWRTAKRPR